MTDTLNLQLCILQTGQKLYPIGFALSPLFLALGFCHKLDWKLKLELKLH